MSNSEVVWSIVKKNSSFIRKNSGVEFTAEPWNITNLNERKYSGLANDSAIDLSLKDNRVVFSKKTKHAARFPKKASHSYILGKHNSNHSNRAARAIRIETEGVFYRPELTSQAIARYHKLYRIAKRSATSSKSTDEKAMVVN